jgi:hypothetical protein
MSFEGHIQNGVVVFDEPVGVAEGTAVRVEVIAPPGKSQHADDPGCFRDLSPAKLPDEKERKALRALLTAEQFDALMDIASRGGPDVDAIARLRAKSMT